MGKLALMMPREHIDGRPLGGDDQVNAGGTGHLGQARDGFFHLFGTDHHEVGQFIYNDDDIGEMAVGAPILAVLPGRILFFGLLHDFSVVGVDISKPPCPTAACIAVPSPKPPI